MSAISFDDSPPLLFSVEKGTKLCLDHFYPVQGQEEKYMQSFHMLCIVFHQVPFSLALQLFL